jgi:hypothetical protein
MPKWSSPLFTDIRNALGESVVFANWKGRSYFRSWVKPANPRTLRQRANRDVLKQLVKRYQELKADPDVVLAWNKVALPYTITGFNLFIKQGMASNVSCPATGSVNVPFVVTYDLGIPADDARLYAIKTDGTIIDVTPAGGLASGKGKTVNVTLTSVGTYYIFLANRAVLKTGDTPPKAYQAITKWSRDNVNGVAKEAKIVIS